MKKPDSSSSPDRPAEDPPASTEPVAAGGLLGNTVREEQTDADSFDEVLDHELDLDLQHRLWVRVVVPLLQLRSHESDPNGRVQFAYDQMHIAACERVARILRSDLARERNRE